MFSRGPRQPDATTVSDLDDSSIYTPTTTADDVRDLVEDPSSPDWVVPDGSTVIIRSVSCGNVLTLLNGHVVLAPFGGRGSSLWVCVETEGWFGFRNCVSNKFICHGRDGRLKCSAEQHDSWRHFTITPVPNQGYILQMLDWWTLCPVVINAENGLQKLGRTGDKLSEGIVWQFFEVSNDLIGNVEL